MTRKGLLSAAVAATLTGLSACTGDTATQPPLPEVVPVAVCAAAAGQLDAVQTAITDNLAPAAGELPEPAAALAAALVAAASQSLDTPEAIANALSDLASSQDPQALADQLMLAGGALRCSLDKLTAALTGLGGDAPPAELEPVLAQIETLQQMLGGASLSSDPAALTQALEQLEALLEPLSENLPSPANSLIADLSLDFIGTAFGRSAAALRDLTALDAAGLAGNLEGLVVDVAADLEAAGVPGLPNVPATLQSAMDRVMERLDEASGQLADPAQLQALTQALQAILSAQGADPAEVLGPIVMDTLQPAPLRGEVSRLLALLSGGGTSPIGQPVPGLGELLASLLGDPAG